MKNLPENIEKAMRLLESCTVCPRFCKINRLKDERGFCGMGKDIMVSSFGPHFGEETELVGQFGSGTIFLTGCNLQCIFCQNYEVSCLKIGRIFAMDEFVNTLMNLEKQGCHNINFVTPTHFAPQVMAAVFFAREKGLTVPVVYNCSGYENIEALRLLDGLIEIYMPDIKFFNPQISALLCQAKDYPKVCREALLEMQRQVGELEVGPGNIAQRGLLIRHLVMPENTSDSKRILEFIAHDLSVNSYVNIMAQYHPAHLVARYKQFNRGISGEEFSEVTAYARSLGLQRGF